MNAMDIKKKTLRDIMDMMDHSMLGKLKKPGMEEGLPEEGKLAVTKVEVDPEVSESPADMIEEDSDIDPSILEELMKLHGDEDEEI